MYRKQRRKLLVVTVGIIVIINYNLYLLKLDRIPTQSPRSAGDDTIMSNNLVGTSTADVVNETAKKFEYFSLTENVLIEDRLGNSPEILKTIFTTLFQETTHNASRNSLSTLFRGAVDAYKLNSQMESETTNSRRKMVRKTRTMHMLTKTDDVMTSSNIRYILRSNASMKQVFHLMLQYANQSMHDVITMRKLLASVGCQFTDLSMDDRETNREQVNIEPIDGENGTRQQLNFEPTNVQNGAALFDVSQATKTSSFKHLQPTIPHIIHQTWDSAIGIPGVFKPWIKSMVDKHPGWEYWFWTPADVECLLKRRFDAKYLTAYKRYRQMIFKSDFLRYFLLWEFGGFYVDLDVEALKPLDFWTYNQQCVMSHENYEHSYLMYNKRLPNVMTTVIGCRPKHPYFKMLQENLIAYQKRYVRDVLHATGPFYLNDIYLNYMMSNYTSDVNNSITVLHPRYWLPRYDYRLTSRLRATCRKPHKLRTNGIELCNHLRRTDYSNKLHPDSFLDHHWTHVNDWKLVQKQRNPFNLFTVVPNAIRASDKLRYCD